MKTVKNIFDHLDKLAPVSLKMDFDNVGILVGDPEKKVNKCLIALDITADVINEAKSFGAELIVSHHPIIFEPLKSVRSDDITGKNIIELIKNDISAICMHTNLDIAEGGVNDALMSALGARVSDILEPCGEDDAGRKVGCGCVGTLDNETNLSDFLNTCKDALNVAGLRYHDAGRKVKKLAVMGGSGGSSLSFAVSAGCDTYVTADIKYNTFLEAKQLGINLIDADHFCTENVVVPVLYKKLSEAFPDVCIKISETHNAVVKFA